MLDIFGVLQGIPRVLTFACVSVLVMFSFLLLLPCPPSGQDFLSPQTICSLIQNFVLSSNLLFSPPNFCSLLVWPNLGSLCYLIADGDKHVTMEEARGLGPVMASNGLPSRGCVRPWNRDAWLSRGRWGGGRLTKSVVVICNPIKF